MKYPKKYKEQKELINIPIKSGNEYLTASINKDGSVNKFTGLSIHHTESSCWVCCNAHNRRVGYSEKNVKKMLKKWAKLTTKNTKSK